MARHFGRVGTPHPLRNYLQGPAENLSHLEHRKTNQKYLKLKHLKKTKDEHKDQHKTIFQHTISNQSIYCKNSKDTRLSYV